MSGRNKIRNQFNSRMAYFEKRFTPVMYKAIRSQIKAFVSAMKSQGVDRAKRDLDRVLINTEVYTAIQKIYKVVGVDAANRKLKEILDQAPRKGFGFNAEWAAEIINYFRLFILNQATLPITQSTRNQILAVLTEGEEKGWGTDEIARKLLATDMTLWRARMIVRTETAKAAWHGRKMGRDKSPYKLTKEWIAANDHRTRHSHRIVDGVVIEAGQRYSVPVYKRIGKVDVQIGVDLMEGPGDPKANKENVINCRCTEADRIVFENDIPVMKREGNEVNL